MKQKKQSLDKYVIPKSDDVIFDTKPISSHYFSKENDVKSESKVILGDTNATGQTNKSLTESKMDKKRLFFSQNFTSNKRASPAKPPIEKSLQISEAKSNGAKASRLDEKRSFFAKMNANRANDKSPCKIDAAFKELTNNGK